MADPTPTHLHHDPVIPSCPPDPSTASPSTPAPPLSAPGHRSPQLSPAPIRSNIIAKMLEQKQALDPLRSGSVHQRLQNLLLNDGVGVFPLSPKSSSFLDYIKGPDVNNNGIWQRINDQTDDPVEWLTVLHYSIAKSDIDTIRILCKAHVNVDAIDTVKGISFSCFQLAGAVYDNRPSELAFNVMIKLGSATKTKETLESLRIFMKHTDLGTDKLQDLGVSIVEASPFPIIACINTASVMTRAAFKIISRREPLERVSQFFTNLAIRLLNSLGSDHVAALALEVKDEDGVSAIEAAIQTGNMEFMTDLMVIRIISNIWTNPYYLAQHVMVEPGQRGSRLPLYRLLISDPNLFFNLNKAKFVLRTIGFIWFLALISICALTRPQLQDPISWLELFTWFNGFGFIIGEISELTRQGLSKYLSSGWNKVDIIAWSALILSCLWRIIHNRIATTLSYQQPVADALISIVVVVLWIRLTRAFAINSSLGILTRMLPQFLRDIMVFSLLLLVVMIGFGISLSISVGESVNAYNTVGGSIFTLYKAALGSFNFDLFLELDTGKRIIAQTLLGVFLLLSVVILVNLLVAMMADTYSKVQDRSQKEFLCGWIELTWEIHQENGVLPPPFNTLVYILSLPYIALMFILENKTHRSRSHMFSKRSLTVILEHRLSVGPLGELAPDHNINEWICAQCSFTNPVRSIKDNSLYRERWIRNIEGYVPESLKLIPDQAAIQCLNCQSLQRCVTKAESYRDQVSFAVFSLLIRFPADLVLFLPNLLQYFINLILKHGSALFHGDKQPKAPGGHHVVIPFTCRRSTHETITAMHWINGVLGPIPHHSERKSSDGDSGGTDSNS